jgi:hypothetical protein
MPWVKIGKVVPEQPGTAPIPVVSLTSGSLESGDLLQIGNGESGYQDHEVDWIKVGGEYVLEANDGDKADVGLATLLGVKNDDKVYKYQF